MYILIPTTDAITPTRHAEDLIKNREINVSQLITHRYNLEECQQAFVHAKSGDNAMKIIISN